jgi:hypothetical protein
LKIVYIVRKLKPVMLLCHVEKLFVQLSRKSSVRDMQRPIVPMVIVPLFKMVCLGLQLDF